MARLDNVPDIEELVSVGRAHSVCPFYMSREISKVKKLQLGADMRVQAVAVSWGI